MSHQVLDIGTQNVYVCTAEDVVPLIRHFNDIWEAHDLAAYAEVVAVGAASSSAMVRDQRCPVR